MGYSGLLEGHEGSVETAQRSPDITGSHQVYVPRDGEPRQSHDYLVAAPLCVGERPQLLTLIRRAARLPRNPENDPVLVDVCQILGQGGGDGVGRYSGFGPSSGALSSTGALSFTRMGGQKIWARLRLMIITSAAQPILVSGM